MSKPLGKKDSVMAKLSAAKPLHDDHSNTESVSRNCYECTAHCHEYTNSATLESRLTLPLQQDLFNFLRQMHLTGGANGMTVRSVSDRL